MIKIPIFIIVHNQYEILKKTVESYEKYIKTPIEIIFHNVCSTYFETINYLNDKQNEGYIVYNSKINNHHTVIKSIKDYVSKNPDCEYIVMTDPDIELNNVNGDILEFYIYLLHKLNKTSVGPMLKIEKYKELKNKKGTKQYEWYFLRYIPAQNKIDKKQSYKIKKLKHQRNKLSRKIPYYKKNKTQKKAKKPKKQKGGERKHETYHEEEEFLNNLQDRLFVIVRNTLIAQGCVFFGAMANRMYLQDLNEFKGKKVPKVPDFDVLSTDPETTTRILKERLEDAGIKNIKIKKHKGIGETLPVHYEVSIGPESFVFIYEPIACHSYNTIDVDNRKIRIATLDTMLSLYLAFIYTNKPYYQVNRILCMSQYLFKVQQKNRLKQKGLLKRFSIDCYGEQTTLEKMRAEKIEKYKELKNKKGTKQYEWYFLRYIPAQNKIDKKQSYKIKKLKHQRNKLSRKIPYYKKNKKYHKHKKHKTNRRKKKYTRKKRKRTFKRLFGF